MAENTKKPLILSTLLLIFCVVIIALYSLIPTGENKPEVKKILLTFNSDGGTAIAALDVIECQKVDRPTNPTKDGYIFVGWELNGEPFDFTQEICSDTELKAVWEEKAPDKVYITVYYKLDDGDLSEFTIEEGTVPDRPYTPTRDGYEFVEWQLNGVTYNFDTPIREGDVIVAIWKEVVQEPEPEPEDDTKYTVKFNLNGGTIGGNCADQSIQSGKVAKNVCKPTKEGYELNGWSPKISSKITKDTTFVAQWKKKTVTPPSGGGGDTPVTPTKISYTIHFNTDGGSSCADKTVTVTKGTKINPKDYCSTTKAHHSVSWNTVTLSDNTSVTVTASWKQNSFSASCTPKVDPNTGTALAQCTPVVKENGKVISGWTLLRNGSPVPPAPATGAWSKFGTLTLKLSDGFTTTVSAG